jgi:hypothetical protein
MSSPLSPGFTTLITSGKPKFEHPLECRDGLAGSDRPLVAHQHRLHNGTSRHRDPDHRRNDVVVHHHDCLPTSEAYQGRTPPTTQMDARPVRYGNQHRSAVLPAPGIRVRFLPTHLDSGTGHHELVRSDVWRDFDHRGGVLCVAGTASLHSARGAGESRGVISPICIIFTPKEKDSASVKIEDFFKGSRKTGD